MSKDIKKLVEIAQSQGNPLKSDKLTSGVELEVKAFVETSGVKEGIVYIPYYLVYDYYCTWSAKPYTIRVFMKEFIKHFKVTRVIGYKCFMIHPPSVGLPEYYSMYKDPRFFNRAKYTSKFVGVYPLFGFYVARYKDIHGSYYIGKYPTEKQAATAYDLYVYKLKGKESLLNFKNKSRIYEKAIKEEESQKQIFETRLPGTERGVSGSE